jgi:hypothetical protein
MAITVIGNLDSSTGTALTSLTLTASASVGSVRAFGAKANRTTGNISSLSGGNVTTWSRVAGPTVDTAGTAATHELWIGTCTSSGTTAITVTWSGTITGISTDLYCRTFDNGNASTTWALDGSAAGFKDNTASTTITYPSLSASGAGELYFAHARCPSGGSYGTPTGQSLTWVTTTDANGNPYIYTLSSASGTNAPTQSTTSTDSHAIAALIVATIPSSAVRPDLLVIEQSVNRAATY